MHGVRGISSALQDNREDITVKELEEDVFAFPCYGIGPRIKEALEVKAISPGDGGSAWV